MKKKKRCIARFKEKERKGDWSRLIKGKGTTSPLATAWRDELKLNKTVAVAAAAAALEEAAEVEDRAEKG